MKEKARPRLRPKEIGMMVLSLISVLVVLAIVFGDPSSQNVRLLLAIDFVICLIFIANFFYGWWRAHNKSRYFKRYWIDLVASIPVIEQLRFVRIFQILRVIRLIRSSHSLLSHLLKQKRETTLTGLMLALFTILILAAISILLVETGAEGGNIHSAEDAIWWTLITISTVGYGDFYPVTTEGRIIGAVVVISGVSFFGVVAGFLASMFLHEDEEKTSTELMALRKQQHELAYQQAQLLKEIQLLRQQLAAKSQDSTEQSSAN